MARRARLQAKSFVPQRSAYRLGKTPVP